MSTTAPARTPLQEAADRFDLVVVGGGPGGYVAAIRAAQHGLRVALVERDHLGGACTNRGCIPTKAMLHGADVAHEIEEASRLGFTVRREGFDLSRLVAYSDSVVQRLRGGIAGLVSGNGIELIAGTATIPGKGVVEVALGEGGSRTLQAGDIILATGARPRPLPGIEPDGDRIWTSTEALRPAEQPASLLVIGSGAIGSEFASLYADLGTRVTLVEAAPRLAPAEEPESSAFLTRAFEARGIEIHAGARISSVQVSADRVTTAFTDAGGAEHSVETDRVLLATGVQPNSEGLGLEALGVQLDRGVVVVDEHGATGVAGLYAIGDLVGAPCLAHKASHEAIVCVEHLAGDAHPAGPVAGAFMPRCVYSRPQLASIGYTEEQARGRGIDVEVGSFDLAGNGKAIARGEPQGFAKVIFDRSTGELVGAHLAGPEATELISSLSIAHSLEATDEALAHTVLPHPTVSEAMHEAVLDALGRVIHWPPARRS